MGRLPGRVARGVGLMEAPIEAMTVPDRGMPLTLKVNVGREPTIVTVVAPAVLKTRGS